MSSVFHNIYLKIGNNHISKHIKTCLSKILSFSRADLQQSPKLSTRYDEEAQSKAHLGHRPNEGLQEPRRSC